MNNREFSQNMESIKRILNRYGFLQDHKYYKKKLSKDYLDYESIDDFKNTYNKIRERQDYHFLLNDDSIFILIFDEDPLFIKYIYYPFPYDYVTFNEFVERIYTYEMGPDPLIVYQNMLDDAPIIEPSRLIRYDYSETEYSLGKHSISHFHIGCEKQVVIPCSKILTPICFILFIIKQAYHSDWLLMINSIKFLKTFQNLKQNCDAIQDCFFKSEDQKELYLI